MARSGLDKSEVKKASEFLRSQGRYPSADAVRVALGNTGSKTTIHRYLKELEKEAGQVSDREAKTAKTLQDFVGDLAARLHAETDTRIDEIRVEHEASLQRSIEEKAVLQKQIDTLNLLLLQAEARNIELTHDLHSEVIQKSSKRPGFGIFGNLINNNRSGKLGWSSFNLLFDSRSNIHADNQIGRASHEIFSRI